MSVDNLEKYLIHLVKYDEFYASLSRRINKVSTDKIPTAGVYAKDGEFYMLWSPKFLASLTDKQAIELIKHEFLHIAFGHCTSRTKMIDGKPDRIWGISCDLSINSLLDISNLPEGGFVPGQFKELSEEKKKLLDSERVKDYEKFAHFMRSLPKYKSADWYYDKFNENPDMCNYAKSLIQSQETQGFDEHDTWQNISSEELQILECKAQEMLNDALNDAEKHGWGTISASAKRLIQSTIMTSISWKDLLRYFIGMVRSTDRYRTYRRLNRRHEYFPGIKRRRTSRIAIAIDMSGSMTNEYIARLFCELQNLADICEFVVVPFDGEIGEPFVWKVGEKIEPQRTKYGSTNFNAPTIWANEHKNKIDGLIIMTDGLASKPDYCEIKRGWILIPNHNLIFDTEEIVINLR